MPLERGVDDELGAGRSRGCRRPPSEHPSPTSAAACLEHVRATARDHHRGAAARELGGRRLAEVGAPAGDDRDLSLQRAVDEDARGLARSLPEHLDHESLRPPAVELAVEDLLPRTEVELARR